MVTRIFGWLIPATLLLATPAQAANRSNPKSTSPSGNTQETLSDVVNITAPRRTGGLFAPVMKLSHFDGERAAFVGARTGLVFNDLVVAGISANMLAGSHQTDDGRDAEFAYAGVFAGVNLFSNRLLHLSLLNHLSWGQAAVSKLEGESDDGLDTSRGDRNDVVTIIEPEAIAELNVTPNIRLGAGVSYRKVSGVNFAYLTERDVRGEAYTVALSFYD